MRKWFNITLTIFIIIGLILLASFVYFLDRANKKLIEMPPKTQLKIDLEDRSYRDVITDIDPRIREVAKRIEMWEKELLEKKASRKEAEKLLLPYINHPNNRIRANACKALYHFNPEKAIEALEEMLCSPDMWMRISGIWALGQIHTDEAIELILSTLDDKVERVRNSAIKTLKGLLNSGKISGNLYEKVKRKLEG